MSFTSSINNGMISALKESVTGDIQIRPSTQKHNIISMDAGDQSLKVLTRSQSRSILDYLKKDRAEIDGYLGRVQVSAYLESRKKRAEATLLGIPPDSAYYKKDVQILSGRYMRPGEGGQMVLSKALAGNLKVGAGDRVEVTVNDRSGRQQQLDLTVAGVANIEKLSSLSDNLSFIDIASAQKLSGLNADEYTDILLYSKKPAADNALLNNLSTKLKADHLKISGWREQGGYMLDEMDTFFVMFYVLIGIVMVVICILIINLVFMMGIDRRREIGTLRAIGYRRSTIVRIFMNEILLITAVFYVIGTLAGSAIVSIIGRFDIKAGSPIDMLMGSNFYLRLPGVGIFFAGMVVVFAVAGLAGFYPSFKSASMRPAEVLRMGGR